MDLATLVLILCTTHVATATLDLQALPQQVAVNLQKLSEKASIKMQKFSEAATENMKIISETLNLRNLKHYDYLEIIPLIQNGPKLLFEEGKHILSTLESVPMIFDPKKGEKLRFFFQKLHGVRGQHLVDALGAGLPLPVLRRMDAIY